MGASAGDLETAVLVAVQQNIGQVIVKTELKQFVTGGSVRPSIFVAMLYAQATLFRSSLEPLVVVGVAAAAILNAVDVVVVVNHLMQQRCYHALDVPAQSSCANVDFMGAAQFGNPGIFPEGEVAVCLGGGLDGDGWP